MNLSSNRALEKILALIDMRGIIAFAELLQDCAIETPPSARSPKRFYAGRHTPDFKSR